MMVKPRKLKGFRDFLPEQMTQRKQMIDTVWKKAATAGFEPIETPVLEYLETLLGSGGQESDKELYQFTDHGDRQVGMRFDLTVPFARFVAEHHGQLVLPFKKLQIGNSGVVKSRKKVDTANFARLIAISLVSTPWLLISRC